MDIVVTPHRRAGRHPGWPRALRRPRRKAARVDFAIVQAAGTNATGRLLARLAPPRPGVEPSVAAVLAGGIRADHGAALGKDVIGFLGDMASI
ncbi:MAG: hypothetical protein U1F77_17380 [Kiritimatiellia bacterium]